MGASVEDLLGREPVTITVGSSASKAVELMAKENVGLTVIVDQTDPKKVIGVVSEKDIIRALAEGRSLEEPVERVGTVEGLVKVKVGDQLAKAARLMNEKGIRHLIVVDEVDRLVGVLSSRDLIGEKVLLTLAEHMTDSELDVIV